MKTTTRYLFLACSLLLATAANAQLYQRVNNRFEYTALLPLNALGLPSDTVALSPYEKGFPHIAMRVDGVYTYKPGDTQWRLFTGNGGGPYEDKLPSGTNLQYLTGGKTLRDFTVDSRAAGDQYFRKLTDSLDPGLIRNLTTYVRHMLSGPSYNPETGVIATTGGSGGGTAISFTEVIEEFSGSTSNTIALAQTPKAGFVVLAYYNGLQMGAGSFSVSANIVTLIGITRESTDKIKIKYSY